MEWVLIFFVLMCYSCRQESALQKTPELTGSWKLVSIVESDKNISVKNSENPEKVAGMIFREKGELEAMTPANYITGYYETGQQNTIQIAGGGTQRSDTPWGEVFVNALPAIDHYELKANELTLYYHNSNKLVFTRVLNL